MRRLELHVFVAASVASLLVACGGGTTGGGNGDGSTTGSPPQASEDERGSVGVPPTAAEYCTMLGFTLVESQCKFPDGSSCEEWSFYRGECGQAHSYCNQHGGSISEKTQDMGTWTAIYGVCDVGGKQCEESAFVKTGKCP